MHILKEEKAEKAEESGQNQNSGKKSKRSFAEKLKNLVKEGTDRQEQCLKCGRCFGCCRPVKCDYFHGDSNSCKV